jgi:hypothetical protein
MKPTRYWFVIFPGDRYGRGNIGVSAYTVEQAKSIIANEASRDFYVAEISKDLNDNTEIIEDIDIRLLDKGFVIPNMGVVTFVGIWWPNLSLQG